MTASIETTNLTEQEAQNFLKNNTDIKNVIVSAFDNTGIAGFQFNIIKSENVQMQNDITDYYTDSNAIFQDHIAHKPIYVTVTGLQGEYFYSVHKIKDTIAAVGTTMKLIQQFKPQFNAIQTQLREKWNNYRNQVEAVSKSQLENYDLYDPSTYGGLSLKQKAKMLFNQLNSYNGLDLFKLFQSLCKLKSAQGRAYLFFETLRLSNKPFTVETRWKRYESMYIESINITGEDSADITEFQIRFKQLNFTSSQSVKINAAGRTQQQYWEEVNKGIDNGTQTETIKGTESPLNGKR